MRIKNSERRTRRGSSNDEKAAGNMPSGKFHSILFAVPWIVIRRGNGFWVHLANFAGKLIYFIAEPQQISISLFERLQRAVEVG
jgi:hypothetical protein